MHVLTHFFINVLIGCIAKLKFIEILLLGLGGIFPDIDHILYIIFGEKIHSIKKAWKFHKREFKLMRPHFFVLHFIEIIIILSVVSYFINWYLFLIFLGFILHWIADAIKYLWFYKSLLPWIKYYSLIGYFLIKI